MKEEREFYEATRDRMGIYEVSVEEIISKDRQKSLETEIKEIFLRFNEDALFLSAFIDLRKLIEKIIKEKKVYRSQVYLKLNYNLERGRPDVQVSSENTVDIYWENWDDVTHWYLNMVINVSHRVGMEIDCESLGRRLDTLMQIKRAKEFGHFLVVIKHENFSVEVSMERKKKIIGPRLEDRI